MVVNTSEFSSSQEWDWGQEGNGTRTGREWDWGQAGNGTRDGLSTRYFNHVLCLNSFSVKAGNVTDKHCSLSGHSLVFGLGKPSAELVSRIGVTPPLDLSLCAEGREPTRELL